MSAVSERMWQLLSLYGLQVVAALAILVLGFWASRLIRNAIRRLMHKKKVDETLTSFACNLAYAALLVFVIIAAVNKLGFQTTSFIAIIGAAGLAIGLALQGSLANFAAGVLMIIFRPFKAGDYIEGGGTAGTVEEIEIFTTKLVSPDNKYIIVPNAKMLSDNIVNYSTKETRRVTLTFGISYGDDVDKARSVIQAVIDQDDRILQDPMPAVLVSALSESSVDLSVRVWTKNADFWGVHFDLMEKVKKAFDAQGLTIPFPQRDVHLYQQSP
ncbi:MAG: mechanosensitive ion channel [Desulfohalobiaceae bacterium]|nr:mechanosensitive ion channel [Desulfohalobiaceae bacterium]